MTGSDDAGGIVGYASGDTVIEACQSKVNVTAYPGTAAGIAGINEGTIRHCIQTGDIRSPEAAGGIAGNNVGTIEHCYSIGTIQGQNTGAGGIAVENSGTIRFCAAMEESITARDPGMIGGIVLSNTGTLENNYIWSEMKLEGTLVPSSGTEESEEASAANQTPVTALAGDGWTATAVWSPAPGGTFGYGTAYSAAITVTLNSGYMLDNDAAFFVNGQTAAYEGSGPYLITIAFPATEEAPKPPEEETEQPETPPEEGEQPETPSGEEGGTEQPETPAEGGDRGENPGGSSGGTGGDAGAAAPETTAAEGQTASAQTSAAADGADTGDTAPIMLLTLTLLADGTIALAIIHKKQDRA